jgi:hypothetical protein
VEKKISSADHRGEDPMMSKRHRPKYTHLQRAIFHKRQKEEKRDDDFVPDITKNEIADQMKKCFILLPDLVKICAEYAECEYLRLWKWKDLHGKKTYNCSSSHEKQLFYVHHSLLHFIDGQRDFVWMDLKDIKLRIGTVYFHVTDRVNLQTATHKANILLRECERLGRVESLVRKEIYIF